MDENKILIEIERLNGKFSNFEEIVENNFRQICEQINKIDLKIEKIESIKNRFDFALTCLDEHTKEIEQLRQEKMDSLKEEIKMHKSNNWTLLIVGITSLINIFIFIFTVLMGNK